MTLFKTARNRFMIASMIFIARLVLATVLFVGSTCSERADEASSPETPQKEESPALIDTFDIDYIMGKFEPSRHEAFVEIDTAHADRPGLYMRKDAYAAFQAMYDSAQLSGLRLQIRSAARNFDYQKGIWERKWTGQTRIEGGKDASEAYPDPKERALRILKYSSMPGTSRHHWGTDIDLNAFENTWFESGEGLEIFNWLTEHAEEFGFCRPYTQKDSLRPDGYEEEKWHWSYTPVSSKLTLLARDSLSDLMITGFAGATTASEIGVVEKYVLGINPECL